MKNYRCFIVAGLLSGLLWSIQPAWGVLNNGFDTDKVYLIRWSGDFAPIRRHNESDGVEVGDRWQVDNTWKTLSFSGGFTASDARLFVAKDNGTDITIGELDANGNLLNSANLSTIIGASPNRSVMECMRYNRYHNSLIVGAKTTAGVATAWEVNLALNHLYHTYVGEGIPDGRSANVAFDENTGA